MLIYTLTPPFDRSPCVQYTFRIRYGIVQPLRPQASPLIAPYCTVFRGEGLDRLIRSCIRT
jgi:hypothetical protein